MVLSATSTPKQVQSYCESKLEKHQRGVLGPKNPTNHLLVFVDDLNMPAKEIFGARPALEMLRQLIDFGGFYAEKSLERNEVNRLRFMCAMATPGGPDKTPSLRLLRHFSVLHLPELSRETMTRIFVKILGWGFESHPESWKAQI